MTSLIVALVLVAVVLTFALALVRASGMDETETFVQADCCRRWMTLDHVNEFDDVLGFQCQDGHGCRAHGVVVDFRPAS